MKIILVQNDLMIFWLHSSFSKKMIKVNRDLIIYFTIFSSLSLLDRGYLKVIKIGTFYLHVWINSSLAEKQNILPDTTMTVGTLITLLAHFQNCTVLTDVNGCSIPFGADVPYKDVFTPACLNHDVCYRCVSPCLHLKYI